MTDMIELPPRMLDLYRLLRLDRDTPITALHERYLGRRPPANTRDAQREVTSYVNRLNGHLAKHGYAVRPGRERRTYRLYAI